MKTNNGKDMHATSMLSGLDMVVNKLKDISQELQCPPSELVKLLVLLDDKKTRRGETLASAPPSTKKGQSTRMKKTPPQEGKEKCLVNGCSKGIAIYKKGPSAYCHGHAYQARFLKNRKAPEVAKAA